MIGGPFTVYPAHDAMADRRRYDPESLDRAPMLPAVFATDIVADLRDFGRCGARTVHLAGERIAVVIGDARLDLVT